MMNSFKTFLRRLGYFCKKELLATLKDPASRVILIAPILMQTFLFGYAATFNLEKVPYAILDQSKSRTSQEFLARLDGSSAFKRVDTLQNSSQIAQSIDSGKALLVIQIGSDFQDLISSSQNAPIQIISDGRNSMTASVATSYVSEIINEFNASRNGSPGINLITRTWYNPNQITKWYFLPGMIAALTLVQVLLLAGLSVAREREQGTFDQLLVTPLSPFEILIGKAIPPMLIGMAQATIVVAICVWWFKIPFAGSLGTFYLALFLFMLSCIGVGLSISAVSVNMQQVLTYSFVFIMPVVLLSGLATPIRNMPEILQKVTYANPMRFGVECVRRIYLEGATLGDVYLNFIPLIIIAVLTMPLAAWLFRNRLT